MNRKKIIEASGLGNSFLIMDMDQEDITKISDVRLENIRHLLELSHRDSALIIGQVTDQTRQPITRMRIIESDGTESSMCGNGLRVVGQYYYEHLNQPKIEVMTKAGQVSSERLNADQIRTYLGKFHYLDSVDTRAEIIHDTDVGEPHAVVFSTHSQVDRLMQKLSFPIVYKGEVYGVDKKLPHGTRNLNIVVPDLFDPNHLHNRTFERGVNHETLACGTGAACAAATYAKVFLNQENFSVRISTLSGDLQVDGYNKDVYVTGPAKIEKIMDL